MANGVLPATLGVRIARCFLSSRFMEPNGIGALVNAVRERFPNLTHSGVSYRRSIPRQEPVQAAEPFTEFRAKGTGASKIANRFLTPSPDFFHAESAEVGGRRIGFSPRTPRLRVRL